MMSVTRGLRIDGPISDFFECSNSPESESSESIQLCFLQICRGEIDMYLEFPTIKTMLKNYQFMKQISARQCGEK
jgi:hypothetical protein